MKYLTEEGKQKLDFALPEISFNYLGQMGFSSKDEEKIQKRNEPNSLYSLEETTLISSKISFPSGPVVAPDLLSHVLININGSAGVSGLSFDFDYASEAFSRTTIEQLANSFHQIVIGFLD